MNDTELASNWTALDPTVTQRRRIDARVRGWLQASEISLAGEWFALLRVNPIARIAFAAVAAALVLLASPLSWLALGTV